MATSPNITNITPPRVPIIDDRTGLISREWYRFFLSLFILTGSGQNYTSLTDIQVVPPGVQVDEITHALIKLSENVSPSDQALLSQIVELRKQVEALALQVRPELGTMSQLHQANVPWVTFDTSPESVPSAPGTLYWDTANGHKTLSLVMENGDAVQQIGEEQYFRIKASSVIIDGQVVMFTGTVGASGALTGAPATGLTAATASYVMGIATQHIPKNGWGYVTSFGLVRGLDTSAFTDGDILYLNPSVAGGLTATLPTAPSPKVQVCACIYSSASNGSLFIRPSFGGILGQYEGDVNVTGVAALDLLQRNAANTRWENVTATSVVAAAGGAPVTKTANFSVASGDTWLINNESGSSCTVTLPSASMHTGRVLRFQNYQAQTLVSASSNVVPLVGGAASTAILAAVAGDTATLVSDGTNWIMTQYVPNNVLLLE
jgi:hypothetical protein